MKFYLSLITVCLSLFTLATFAESAELDAVSLHSIQADFIQEKHLKILARPIISTGTLTFQAPQSLRWEYQTPIPSILLMNGSKVKKFIERDGQLVEDRGMQFNSMQVVLAEISNWLDGRFTDNDMFVVSFPAERTVLLTPKQQALAGLISKIELKLADQKELQGLLDSVTIFEGPDSYTMMTFSNRILNQDLDTSVFTTR